jgi:hypothetical protein
MERGSVTRSRVRLSERVRQIAGGMCCGSCCGSQSRGPVRCAGRADKKLAAIAGRQKTKPS